MKLVLSNADWIALIWFQSIQEEAPELVKEDQAAAAWSKARRDENEPSSVAVAQAKHISESLEPVIGLPPAILQSRSYLMIFMTLLFLIGMTSNLLGPDEQVNLLYNPLMILMAWQVIVLLVWLLRGLFLRLFSKHIFMFSWAESILRLGSRLPVPWSSGLGRKIRKRFWSHWLRQRKHAGIAWVIRYVHLGFVSVVVGCLIGLYLRGLVESYGFEWRSTFIQDPQTVQDFVAFVFYLPSMVTGVQIPTVAAAGEWMPGSPWIHLFAMASFLYVVIPRLALLQLSKWSLKGREKQNLDPFIRGLLAEATLTNIQDIWVLGYSYQIPEVNFDWLSARLRAACGNGQVHRQKVAWEQYMADVEFKTSTWCVVVFNGVQTPEVNVHGEFITRLVHDLQEVHARLSIMVDCSLVPSELMNSRKETWRVLLSEYELEMAWLPLESGTHPATAETALASVMIEL